MNNDKLVSFDAQQCSACNACAVACIDQNDLPVGNGQVCAYRFAEDCEARNGNCFRFFRKMHGCMHCLDAPCLAACPMDCFSRDNEFGLVLIDNENCVGCHACEGACPYDAIRFDEEEKAAKCDGCIERLRQGLRPACERICPPKALVFNCK
ncbi:MAG: 4Fe-4S dicluster domain-containing protein [Oscillospiraceae bacterium]|nr:4Fe-4S dicluster domain-containing protein [Oscillospiraceae bacterium]